MLNRLTRAVEESFKVVLRNLILSCEDLFCKKIYHFIREAKYRISLLQSR